MLGAAVRGGELEARSLRAGSTESSGGPGPVKMLEPRMMPMQTYPHFFSLTEGYGTSSARELEDAPSSGGRDQDNLYREKKERRKKKIMNEEAKVTKSELIQGHRGKQELEELLDFINGTRSKKNTKKKPQENGLPEKSTSKKKVAKSRSKSVDDKFSENGSERGDDASSKVSDIGEDKVKALQDLADEDIKGNNDSGSESSISSDLNNKDTVTTTTGITTVPTDSLRDDTTEKPVLESSNDSGEGVNKAETDEGLSSGGENGPAMDMYSASLVTDGYIFTDYDSVSLPVEEDFVTVSTKKKKVRPVSQQSYQPQHYQNNYNNRDSPFSSGSGSHFSYNGHRESSSFSMGDSRASGAHFAQLAGRGEDRRGVRPSRPLHRSVTPPPPSSISSSYVTDAASHSSSADTRERERALSPASSSEDKGSTHEEGAGDVPVMGGADQSNEFPRLPSSKTSRDGRRNSTGNVPSDTLSPDADSDMESVKSLPLSSSNNAADGGLSSLHHHHHHSAAVTSNIISYARIAAGTRGGGGVGGTGAKTASASNSTSTASVNSVPSSTVSSTQNYASASSDVMTSSIDVTKQDEGYVTTDAATDSSSGLSNNVSASSSKSDELSSLLPNDSNTVDSNKPDRDKWTRKSPDLVVADSVEVKEATAAEGAAALNSSSSAVGDSSCSDGGGGGKNHKADVNKLKTVISDKSGTSKVPSENGSASEAPVPSNNNHAKSASNGCSKRTGKSKSSVVFLDKKMDLSSKSLSMEITFGFDEQMDDQTGPVPEGPTTAGEEGAAHGMQFGGSAVVYPGEGGFAVPSGGPRGPTPPREMCGVKGPVPGMNGVITPQDVLGFPPGAPVPAPRALALPVSLAHPPPPAHIMMVPPPTSGQMMIPPPTVPIPPGQFIPVSHAAVPPPQVVTSMPPPPRPMDSPVQPQPQQQQPAQTPAAPPQKVAQGKATTNECDDPVSAGAGVPSDADFPPLSATVGKGVSPVPPVSSSLPAGPAASDTGGDGEQQCAAPPAAAVGLEFLQPSLHEEPPPPAGATPAAECDTTDPQGDDDDDDLHRLKKFWPSREDDPNFDSGNFMVNEAVFYLTKGMLSRWLLGADPN